MADVDVKYLGFVHTDIKSGGRPGMEQVKLAYTMMQKKNLKKTRSVHPLFARGFDTTLRMEVSEKGLFVALPANENNKSDEEACLMNQAMHKIAFVASIGKTVFIMIKRSGKKGLFKCHAFVTDGEATAIELTKTLSRITNEVFAKLRHVTRILEAQRKKKGPPKVERRSEVADDQQPWYHGKMNRKVAEQLLLDQNMTNGLFLVRQSDRSETDFALSFSFNRRAYHNRIMKLPDGKGFQNTKGTVWPSLSRMVAAYQSPHEDMQTIITEYVARDTQGPGGAYMNVALVQEAARAKTAQKAAGTVWDNSEIQSALGEINDMGEPVAAVAQTDGDEEIAFDPVYDEVQFGFGQDFIKATLGQLNGGVQPKAEHDLDNDIFSLGDIEGEADC
eukprot:m.337450 g.337450  ORF g.337450 m.337450 type:complete len:390 (-) comp18136_c0_seq1:104-1273(-)